MKKFWYYFFSWTWGLPMTLIGALVAGICMALGCEEKTHAGATYFEFGEGWGGLSLGCFFFCSKRPSKHTKDHEFGHSIQNCFWGPLFPFVIAIPSAIRYHQRNLQRKRGKTLTTNYDDIWFEGQASEWGKIVANEWNEK